MSESPFTHRRSESPLRVEKATKERITVPVEQLFSGLHIGTQKVVLPPIVIRSSEGRIEVADKNITGAEALAAAQAEWPSHDLIRVLRMRDGRRVQPDEWIYSGEVVAACGWEVGDA